MSYLSPEGGEGLDEHRGLQGHVEAAGDPRSLQGLGRPVQLPHLHQARHLILGYVDGLAPPLCQANVGWGENTFSSLPTSLYVLLLVITTTTRYNWSQLV